MNTINSISSRNLDTIEVIINIRPAKWSYQLSNAEWARRLRIAPRVYECPLVTSIRDEDPEVPRRASIFSPRTLIKTQGDRGDKRERHKDGRMLVRCRSSTHLQPTPPNVIPLSVHNEDDETCRGCVIETRSMCSNGALRKIYKKNIWIKIQPMFGRSISLLQSVLHLAKHIFLLWCTYVHFQYPLAIVHYVL